MALTKAQVKHVAQLARLGLSEKETEKFKKDFERILEFVKKLNQVKTDKVEPTAHITGLQNVMREDQGQAVSQAEKDRLMSLVPQKKDNQVKVKAVF